MADRMSKLRDFLISEAKRHRHLTSGPRKRVNGKRLARELGVDQATVSRILRLKRNVHEGGEPRGYRMSAELEDALMRWRGFRSLADLYEAIDNAPPAPPLAQGKRRRPPKAVK